MVLIILNAAVALLGVLEKLAPAISRAIDAGIEARRVRNATLEQKAKDDRNDAAITEAQKAIPPKT